MEGLASGTIAARRWASIDVVPAGTASRESVRTGGIASHNNNIRACLEKMSFAKSESVNSRTGSRSEANGSEPSV
jgi:hypothetical protein